LDTIIAFSGISYEKIVQEKDPGNHENGVQVSKISGRELCQGRGCLTLTRGSGMRASMGYGSHRSTANRKEQYP